MKRGRIKGAIGAAVLGTALVLGGCQGASGAFKTQEYVSDNDISGQCCRRGWNRQI